MSYQNVSSPPFQRRQSDSKTAAKWRTAVDKLQRGVAAPPPVPRLTVTTLPMFPPDSPVPAPAPTKDLVGVLSMLINIFYKL